MTTAPTPSDKARKPQLNLSLEPTEKDLVERVAKRRGLSVSALVRMLTLDEARRLGME